MPNLIILKDGTALYKHPLACTLRAELDASWEPETVICLPPGLVRGKCTSQDDNANDMTVVIEAVLVVDGVVEAVLAFDHMDPSNQDWQVFTSESPMFMNPFVKNRYQDVVVVHTHDGEVLNKFRGTEEEVLADILDHFQDVLEPSAPDPQDLKSALAAIRPNLRPYHHLIHV